MKTTVAVSAVALAMLQSVQASPLGARGIEERAVSCSAIMPAINADLARATRFCNVYLQLIPQTVTNTATATLATKTVTQAAYTTTTATVTPAVVTKSTTTTVMSSSTVTPNTKTVTSTITSTAYLDPYGSTIAVMKREAEPSHVELAARAIVTPSYFKALRKTDIRAACNCMNLAAPTYTRKVTVQATGLATQSLMRTMKSAVTLDPVTQSTTIINTQGITVTAAAPLATATAYAIQQVSGCPAGTTATWLCPEMTGDDTGADANYKTCPVLAQDGFSGSCLYWSDDGSPAASTLVLGDGSGVSDNDKMRSATYGDDQSDDCPSWADWTCAASSGGKSKRSVLELQAAEFKHTKRGFAPKKISLAEHKKAGKRTMPKGLKRGGKYVKTAV